jgi:sugar porter (SP) family MFS transporter
MDETSTLVNVKRDFTGAVRLITSMTAIAEGYDIGVFAGVTVRVKDDFGLTPVQVGLLVGGGAAGAPPGAFLGSWLADRYGRVKALLATHFVLAASAAGVSLAPTFLLLMFARLSIGVALGMGICVESVYIAECTPSGERGVMTSAVEIGINMGILAGFLANYMLLGLTDADWRIMLAIGVVLPTIAICMILMGMFPESPRWLMLRGDRAGAEANLLRLVDPAEAKDAMQRWKNEPEAGDIRLLFRSAMRRRMVLAGVGVAVFQLLSGMNVVTVLSSYIIETRWSVEEAFLTTLVMGVFKTLTLLIACFFLIDSVGRRPLLLVSAIGMALSAMFIAAAFFLRMSLTVVQVAFCLMVTFFSIGFGPVTYAYMPEVFDTSVRSAGVGLSLFVSRIMSAIVMITVPMAFQGDAEMAAPLFLFFAAMNVLSFLYVYAFCPETAKKTLEEMIDVFKAE